MPPTPLAYFNREFIPASEAKVGVMTHALHYGTAVFEGVRAYPTDDGPALLRPHDHMKRLLNSARLYGMTVPYTGEIRLDNGWLADAVIPMTVTLYDAVEGGNAVFQEEHSSVVVEAGIFELVLGSIGDLGSIDWTP